MSMVSALGRAVRRGVRSRTFARGALLAVACTWLVHGLYNKLLGGSPRHLAIVQATPGLDGPVGEYVLAAVGMGEIAIAVWVAAGIAPLWCAAVQTTALLSMNAVEVTFARHLLLWPAGLIPVNLGFLALAWAAARHAPTTALRVRLRRHPMAVRAHFDHCMTLTYALPADVLRPLVPPGLELETLRGYGFVAVALVQTRSLRPAALPPAVGQDFFLAGYRVFTTFRRPDGRRLRGLRILRSDANRLQMVLGGNLLTYYNYRRCTAALKESGGQWRVAVNTPDGSGDLDVIAGRQHPDLPAGSVFTSVTEARRFAGPLPFTFDYEPETHAIIAIEAIRTKWRPELVSADVRTLAWLHASFPGVTPVLSAAFRVADIDYEWKRGCRYPLRGREQPRQEATR